MNKISKYDKGITIISLIITIIIMLILVGATIDLAIDGDLFDKAQTAVNKTNDQVNETKNIVNNLIDEWDRIEQN